MSVDHYENFPVASWLMPSHLRASVAAIYHFARTADDIADEGHASNETRLQQLQGYRASLRALEHNDPGQLAGLTPNPALFERLGECVSTHQLPWQPFHDLLSAFEQDITVKRYADDAELLDYCSRSANPVGCLMLHLYKAASPQNMVLSDAICTGLQLVNFWQDIAIDWSKGRVYLPQNVLHTAGISEDQLATPSTTLITSDAWRTVMRRQIDQARQLLLTGAPLARRISGRMGWELRLVVLGGLRILERIEAVHYDVFTHRPTLKKYDWALLAIRSIIYSHFLGRRADTPPSLPTKS